MLATKATLNVAAPRKKRCYLYYEQAIRMTPAAAMSIVSRVIENRVKQETLYPLNDVGAEITADLGFKFEDFI